MTRRVTWLVLIAIIVAVSGCSLLAQIAGESVGVPLDSKVVGAKSEPNVLIAMDASTCTVAASLWEKAEVGRRFMCAWSDG